MIDHFPGRSGVRSSRSERPATMASTESASCSCTRMGSRSPSSERSAAVYWGAVSLALSAVFVNAVMRSGSASSVMGLVDVLPCAEALQHSRDLFRVAHVVVRDEEHPLIEVDL